MRITFCGATREVTGSCYLVETARTRVLVDCGLFQGGHTCSAKNFEAFPFDVKTIDAVLLTHAHADHVGRLPKLVREGFRGRVYAIAPTLDLAKIVLEDTVHLMREDFERDYRPMLYEEHDVEGALNLRKRVEYETPVRVGDLSVRFREAGHIFGSAFLEVTEQGGGTAVFSGDLGNTHVPILRPTAQIDRGDVVIMETTYGNRIHEDESTREEKLHTAIATTIKQKGVLLIPAFAIERTQQLLYELNHLVENRLIPKTDVYLDSPMAIQASEVIASYPQYYEPEALRLVSHGDDLFNFPGLHVTRSRDESKAINAAPFPKVIISGSGMMNGGRIMHHLVRYLGHTNTTLLIIGYQSPGTVGHKLYRGDKQVQIMGEVVEVRARVASIGAYSAHADQLHLESWIQKAKHLPAHVYCTHGDEGASMAMATKLQLDLRIDAHVPRLFETISL